jgi:pseudouridine synthase
MRINKFVAKATGNSRRKADQLIKDGQVSINGEAATLGHDVTSKDVVVMDGETLTVDQKEILVMLNKPVGYVCSKDGQGSMTVYDMLPPEYADLKIVGRLDKDSSGLVILTNNGDLANELTHPRYQKEKLYIVELDKELSESDLNRLIDGINLEDGLSKFNSITKSDDQKWLVSISEGRNRQIRRTFKKAGYDVVSLERISIGDYKLGDLDLSQHKLL